VQGATVVAGGRALVATLVRDDYAACDAGEEETEGIAESLRAVDGVEAAAVVREQSSGPRVRVSLRSSALDVSAIAALRGGGGHRLAAGFSSDESAEEVSAWLSSELARRLSTASS
jgi:phosphoesterase RecJ-like protein